MPNIEKFKSRLGCLLWKGGKIWIWNLTWIKFGLNLKVLIKLTFFFKVHTIWWGLVQKNLLSLHPTKPRCHFPWGKQFIVVFTPCPATGSVHIFYPSGCTMSQFGEIILDRAFLQFIYTSFYMNIFTRFFFDFHDHM